MVFIDRLKYNVDRLKARVDNFTKKLNTIFQWFQPETSLVDKTRTAIQIPGSINWAEQLVCNAPLCRGFYKNTYPGLKLAGAFAKTPIDKPIQFMGLPIPESGNKNKEKFLIKWVTDNPSTVKAVHTESHVCGTVWVWPWMDSKSRKIIVEFLQDENVSIIKDLTTGEPIKLILDEQIEVQINETQTTTVRRKRIFTKDTVSTIWTDKSSIPGLLEDIVYANPIGVLPIAFTNNRQHGKVRGESDYTAILPDCKLYHDTHINFGEMLSKFSIKMIQSVRDGQTSVAAWKANNGITDAADLDIYTLDLLINCGEDEKTEYIFPDTGAFKSYIEALGVSFWKIVQGSGIPEIYWGLNAQGNHASVEDSRGDLVKYVGAKREQHNESWNMFFEAIAKLNNIATMSRDNTPITTTWNKLDALDDKARTEIFKMFTEGISALINSASATKEQIYALWVEMYPQITIQKYKKWVAGLSEMAKHKAFTAESYSMIMDLQGDETDAVIVEERAVDVSGGADKDKNDDSDQENDD